MGFRFPNLDPKAAPALGLRIKAAIEDMLQEDSPDYAWTGNAIRYLGWRHTNAKRCENCRSWATDINQPDTITTLASARYTEGRFYCFCCQPQFPEDSPGATPPPPPPSPAPNTPASPATPAPL